MPPMQLDRNQLTKIIFISVAAIIAVGSLVVSGLLTSDLKREEQAKVEVWAEAMRSFIKADSNTDLSLVLKIVEGNHTIPVVLRDSQGQIIDCRNVDVPQSPDSLAYLRGQVDDMVAHGRVMSFSVPRGDAAGQADTYTICYGESLMLRRLAAFPYVTLAIIAVFILIATFALIASKRAEQNKVWVGLSRETAHQLGTPISSLMAWTELLKETHPDEPLIADMSQDVDRLSLIAERFSKIGSAPSLQPTDVVASVTHAADYLRRRTSRRVTITVHAPATPIMAQINAPLFEWVIENLCKNAVDAMSGDGSIDLSLSGNDTDVLIEVSDTGKGIPKQKFKTVFRPGYTTKRRGWGLGLSLAARIIREYHRGQIFVKSSTLGVGTTFCIVLHRS